MEMGRSRTAGALNEFIPFAGMAVCVIVAGIDASKIIFGVATILIAVLLYVPAFWHREATGSGTSALARGGQRTG